MTRNVEKKFRNIYIVNFKCENISGKKIQENEIINRTVKAKVAIKVLLITTTRTNQDDIQIYICFDLAYFVLGHHLTL